MNVEELRKQQITDAKRRITSSSDGRVSKPAYSNGGTSGSKKPFVAKGHDSYLKDAQDRNARLRIIMMSGETVLGNMVARDKFTVTLDLEDILQEDGITRPTIRRTIYKHAIESFERAGV